MSRLLTVATIMLALGVALGSAGGAWAGVDEGLAAYEERDYKTALSELLPLAKEGDAKAQFYLGIMYKDGSGVPRNYEDAANWMRKAAEQGDMDAQFQLGMWHTSTRFVPKDIEETFRWWNQAASQGHPVAHYYLGLLHAEVDPQDPTLALMWLNLSVIHGNEGLGEDRANWEKGASQVQIREAQKLAMEWVAEHEGSIQRGKEWIEQRRTLNNRARARNRLRQGNLFFSKDLYTSLKKNGDDPAQFDNLPLTPKEIRDFKSLLRQCWKLPSNLNVAENSTVKLRVLLNPDGSLSKSPQIILDDYFATKPGEKSFDIVTSHAIRAVLDCEPFNLPDHKYERWREMVLTFRQGYNEDQRISLQ